LTRKRIPELDGLRGVAIAAVLSFHFISNSSGGDFGSFLYRFKAAFRMGWAGVDLFFVLSGFLIGSILLFSRESRTYFSHFYIRRSFRILPVYLAWLVLCLLVAVATSHAGIFPNEIWSISIKLPYYLVFLQTFVSWPLFSFAQYWLGPLWSLAVEEQFYLAAAPLVRYVSSKSLAVISVAAIVISPVMRLIALNRFGGIIYILMVFRTDALMAGVFLALIWKDADVRSWIEARKKWVFRLCLALAAPMPLLTKWFPLAYEKYAVVTYSYFALLFFMVILSLLVDTTTWFSGFMRNRALVELGRISYCVYVVNLGVLGLCHSLIRHKLPSIADAGGISVTVFALALTLSIAWLSMRYFESELLAMGSRYKHPAALSFSEPR
jgi:peptidoglycan/LPS O-acetylase OafA/YrhL